MDSQTYDFVTFAIRIQDCDSIVSCLLQSLWALCGSASGNNRKALKREGNKTRKDELKGIDN